MTEFQFSYFQFVLQAVTSLILVLVANYWLLVPTIFMGCLFYGLRHIYVKTARCLKRLESMGNDRMVWILSVSDIDFLYNCYFQNRSKSNIRSYKRYHQRAYNDSSL